MFIQKKRQTQCKASLKGTQNKPVIYYTHTLWLFIPVSTREIPNNVSYQIFLHYASEVIARKLAPSENLDCKIFE